MFGINATDNNCCWLFSDFSSGKVSEPAGPSVTDKRSHLTIFIESGWKSYYSYNFESLFCIYHDDQVRSIELKSFEPKYSTTYIHMSNNLKAQNV